jgi:hypothetical protein
VAEDAAAGVSGADTRHKQNRMVTLANYNSQVSYNLGLITKPTEAKNKGCPLRGAAAFDGQQGG